MRAQMSRDLNGRRRPGGFSRDRPTDDRGIYRIYGLPAGTYVVFAGGANAFSSSDQNAAANFVETLPPAGAGTTAGMLGYMFWAAGCQGNGTGCTFPPTTCEGGVGAGATALNIPIPMPALRTQ